MKSPKSWVTGEQFAGNCERPDRAGVAKTQWPIGTEEKNSKYLGGVTIGKRLE
jgi:hypothetical protein